MVNDDEAHHKKLWYRVAGLTLVIGGFFGYDYLHSKNSSADAERQHIKHLVEGGE